jgi:hypothetical protein
MGRPSWAEKLLNKKPDEGKRLSLFLNQKQFYFCLKYFTR